MRAFGLLSARLLTRSGLRLPGRTVLQSAGRSGVVRIAMIPETPAGGLPR